jgi:hypothetical protein
MLAQDVEVTGFAKAYVKSHVFTDDINVPDSHYALYNEHGKIIFYEVRTGKKKWAGVQFVDRLVGSPGDWRRHAVKGAAKAQVLLDLDMNPKSAAVRFSKHFTICAVCSAKLSDPVSLQTGLGPTCAKRF